VRALPGGVAFRAHMNTLDDCAAQLDAVQRWFDELGQTSLRLPKAAACNEDISLLEAA
jgi:tRNA-dihydrouridine synthase B